jgi:hypothetical protein
MTIQCRTCGYIFPWTLRGEELTKAIAEHEKRTHADSSRAVVGVGRRRS